MKTLTKVCTGIQMGTSAFSMYTGLYMLMLFFIAPISYAQLVVRQPSEAGISLVSNTSYTARWSKGGTTFNRVKIKLSVDGGVTFPYLLVNNTPSTASDTAQAFTVPGIITTQARIRITNQNDSTIGDMSDSDFAITGYCFPPNTVCTANSITNVTFNTSLNNTSTCSGRGYVAYSRTSAGGTRTTSVQRGQGNYPFSITTTSATAGVGIWCDLNNDQDFSDDGEFLYSSENLSSTHSGTLSIPLSASIGYRRLRVRTVDNHILTAGDYCTYFANQSGEIEDYTITITQPTIKYTGAVATICPGTAVTAAFTTTGVFPDGSVYQVQLSAPGGTFTSGTTIVGSGTESPINCFISIGTPNGSYRLRVISDAFEPTIVSTNSSAFTVRAKPSKPTTTSANRCGPGSVTLTASGCATVRWYDAAQQGNLKGTGTSFATESLASSAEFFAACVNSNGCESERTLTAATIKPLPVISNVSPGTGIIDYDVITINGEGFGTLDSVRFFNAKKAGFIDVTPTSITAKPPIGSTTGVITVYTGCGSTNSPFNFIPIKPTIANPVISLASGTYENSMFATLSCATPGAEIWYTLTGIVPIPGNGITKKYTGENIFIGRSMTLKAIGYRNGWTSSAVVSGFYTILNPTIVDKPTISPPTGTYTGGQVVTITCPTPQSTIYFTLNGQVPIPGGNQPVKYYGPFSIIDTFITVRAIGTRDGWADSDVDVSFVRTTGGTALGACSFSPAPGIFGGAQSVTISNADPLASIYFTTDGTDPWRYFPLSKPYTGPVAIPSTATLKAQAFRAGFGDSPRTTGMYVIGSLRMAVDGTAPAPVYYTEQTGVYGITAGSQTDASERNEIAETLNRNTYPNMNVYPNPTHGTLFIDFGGERENMAISIVNMLGQTVRKTQTEGFSFGAAMSIADQKPGFYTIRIQSKNGQIVDKRIVLQ